MNAVQAPGPDHLSYSRVRTFQNCGLACFYRYVSKEPPEFTPAALAFGSAFHRAAEEALAQPMTGVEAVIDDLAKVFEESLDESEAASPIASEARTSRCCTLPGCAT